MQMTCMHMGPLQALVTTLAVVLLASMLVVGSSDNKEVYRFELIHVVDSTSNGNNNGSRFTKDDASSSASDGSSTAADDMYQSTATYSKDRMEYVMELRMGTPAKTFKAVADTGSELIWTKQTDLCERGGSSSFAPMACSAPGGSSEKNKQQQHHHHYDCNQCDKAGQYCMFRKTYGGGKIGAEGFMANETLTLNLELPPPPSSGKHQQAPQFVQRLKPISFGCASKCTGGKGKGKGNGGDDNGCREILGGHAEGIVGLNQGPKSLLTQLGFTRLSYCLSDPTIKPELTSPLWFGSGDRLQLRNPLPWYKFWKPNPVQTTPLAKPAKLDDKSLWGYKYFIQLEGISVVGKKSSSPVVKLPRQGGTEFNHKSDGSAGNNKGIMLVDSGCSYSKLETAAFDVLLELLIPDKDRRASDVYRDPPPPPAPNNNNGHHHSKACFPASALKMPSWRPVLVLHLAGGAQMGLNWTAYMSEVKPKMGEESSGKSSHHFCTSILDSQQDISILGNLQQRNMHMLFNLDEGANGKKLQFEPVSDCSTRTL